MPALTAAARPPPGSQEERRVPPSRGGTPYRGNRLGASGRIPETVSLRSTSLTPLLQDALERSSAAGARLVCPRDLNRDVLMNRSGSSGTNVSRLMSGVRRWRIWALMSSSGRWFIGWQRHPASAGVQQPAHEDQFPSPAGAPKPSRTRTKPATRFEEPPPGRSPRRGQSTRRRWGVQPSHSPPGRHEAILKLMNVKPTSRR